MLTRGRCCRRRGRRRQQSWPSAVRPIEPANHPPWLAWSQRCSAKWARCVCLQQLPSRRLCPKNLIIVLRRAPGRTVCHPSAAACTSSKDSSGSSDPVGQALGRLGLRYGDMLFNPDCAVSSSCFFRYRANPTRTRPLLNSGLGIQIAFSKNNKGAAQHSNRNRSRSSNGPVKVGQANYPQTHLSCRELRLCSHRNYSLSKSRIENARLPVPSALAPAPLPASIPAHAPRKQGVERNQLIPPLESIGCTKKLLYTRGPTGWRQGGR